MDAEEAAHTRNLIEKRAYPADYAAIVQNAAGTGKSALWQPTAGMLSPADFCAALIDHEHIQKIYNTAITRLEKGRKGWMKIDTANVYFDHPFYSTLDHVLAIDFTNEGEGGRDRVAVELSAESARALVDRILAALASGEAAHIPTQVVVAAE